MNRCVIASDSFKGSLSSLQVADSVQNGVNAVFPDCEVVKVCVADGGEGTVETLFHALGGTRMNVLVHDPLERPVTASYVISGDGITAALEMSSASGLPLLKPDERNPFLTTTYGTGELVADALDRGCRRFLVGIGGSATNDAGTGMLAALGYRFLDHEGRALEGKGESLSQVCSIDDSSVHPALKESEFIIACDVDSPFCGPQGAARVYGPQKGATPEMVEVLDKGMEHFAEIIRHKYGTDVAGMPGAGAAGGLGGAFAAFLNGKLCRGADMVLDAIGFDGIIRGADLVITGEGRLDSQTYAGKLPYAVMKRALMQGVRVVAIGGSVEPGMEDHAGFEAVIAVTPDGMSLEEAMKTETASANIADAVSDYLMKDLSRGSF